MSIVFLSMAFHYKYPVYINSKLDDFKKCNEYKLYNNRNLFILYDDADGSNLLSDLMLLCLNYDIKPLVGNTYSDMASYIKAFKYIESRPSVLK